MCSFVKCVNDDCHGKDCLGKLWPIKFVERNYRLYKVTYKKREADIETMRARILVTWAQGGNSAPATGFKRIEEMIRNYCAVTPL